MTITLDKENLIRLIEAADAKWFEKGRGHFDYHAHIEHQADYIVRNYNRKIARSNGNIGSHDHPQRPGGKTDKKSPDRPRLFSM